MNIDPRLHQYIKKKIYYKKHNINVAVPLEQEYRITDDDKKVIQSYIHFRKNEKHAKLIHENMISQNTEKTIEQSKLDDYFPQQWLSEKDDKRMKELKVKLTKNPTPKQDLFASNVQNQFSQFTPLPKSNNDDIVDGRFFMESFRNKEVNVETDMKQGIPTRIMDTNENIDDAELRYKDIAEHRFSYIEPSYGSQVATFPRTGILTRLDNKK